MRSLLLRFFLAFWLMIGMTIGGAALLGFYYSERAHAAIERFEVSEAMLEASAALREDGRDGLTEWLDSLPGVTGSLIYVVDERGDDLLERQLPRAVAFALRRFGHRRPRNPRDFGNLRPARPFTELVGPDGSVYTFFVMPPRGVVGRWLANRSRPGLIILAIIVSAAISYFLARTIARPVRQLRSSATAIAAGKLDTRVASSVANRRDEIGLLAKDFDQMANELQRASQRQTELTRNISHELRSPLARLRVALELARRKSGDLPELDKIDEETERLDELIGQILEFSKLDAENHEQQSRLNLVDIIHAIVDDVRFEYGEDVEVSLTCRTGNELFVTGYESALRGCFENVLRNAARHGTAGGTVNVELTRDGGDAVITVQDDGGGVATHELENLFEPFYRASPTRAEASRSGSGLGLAIAQRAITLHGGSIAAQNAGDGLRVTIRLPGE